MAVVEVVGEKCVWLGSWNFWRSHHLNRKCSHRGKIARGGSKISVGPPEFATSTGHVESLEWKYGTRVQERLGTRDGIY